jgi:hypothetical protein
LTDLGLMNNPLGGKAEKAILERFTEQVAAVGSDADME